MGCGGSKEAKEVKATSTGAAPGTTSNVDDSQPTPIKKVRTNFSDVHYDEPSQGRRDTTYAPSEIPESRRPTEDEAGLPPAVPVVGTDGKLSPRSTSVQVPQINTVSVPALATSNATDAAPPMAASDNVSAEKTS